MIATHWLLLDNLLSGWPFDANMTKRDARLAMAWAKEHGFVDAHGRITDSGRGYFALHGRDKIEEASK